jgi:hypothetical protein
MSVMQERGALLTLIALAVAAAGAAVLLVPRGELKTEAELAAVPAPEALAQLDAVQDPLTPQLAFRQAEWTAASGETEKADTLLAALASRTPQSAMIAAARADLALRKGELLQAAFHLAQAQSAAAQPVLRHRLGLIYRRLGDSGSERALLAAAQLGDLTEWERIRLIDLTASDGATAEAMALAGAAVSLGGPQAPQLAERFVALALTGGAVDELAQAAAGWLSGADGPSLAEPLAQGIALVPRQASALAQAVVSLAPDARAPLAAALTKAQVYGVARELIQPWSERGVPGAEAWATLILYAERSGDVSVLELALQELAFRGLSPEEALPPGALLPLVRYHGGQALLPYQSWLTPEYLADAPLVAASWAIWQQRPGVAFDALQRAAGREVDPVLWRAIADELQGTGYFARLKALARTDPDLAQMFAR